MTTQDWLNIVVFIGGTLGGAILRATWQALEAMRRDLQALQAAISTCEAKTAETYVRRDDFRDAIGEVKELLHRIDAKLDGKADK